MQQHASRIVRSSTASGAAHPRLLVQQVRWFMTLRWIAGALVLAGSVIDWQILGWFPNTWRGILVGAALLAANAAIQQWVRRGAALLRRPRRLLAVIWTQIAVDLLMLSLLVLWTGGLSSPMTGFFVFHMVFASLLLGPIMACAAATLAAALLLALLALAGEAPATRDEWLQAAGLVLTLYVTVLIVNRITRRLRDDERRVLAHHGRILEMSRRLRDQQQAMVQHEKMVALGQMAAGLAHEIANPLASMDSVLQLMQRNPEAPRSGALLTLRQQIERIHTIVRQMTSFARPDSPSGTPIPLGQLIDRVIQVVDLDRRLDRVRIVRDVPEPLARTCTLPLAMQQVLVNLAINAIDAMAEAPDPVLTFAASRDHGCVVLRVTDTGTGIAPEHLSRIFEPFFTTKPVGKGTGLGLSISYRLVERHGGRLEVESRPGAGATFTLRFPEAHPPRHA